MASGDKAIFEIHLTEDAVQPQPGQPAPSQPPSSSPTSTPTTPTTTVGAGQPGVGGQQPSAMQQSLLQAEELRLTRELLEVAKREESLSKQLLGKAFDATKAPSPASASPTTETERLTAPPQSLAQELLGKAAQPEGFDPLQFGMNQKQRPEKQQSGPVGSLFEDIPETDPASIAADAERQRNRKRTRVDTPSLVDEFLGPPRRYEDDDAGMAGALLKRMQQQHEAVMDRLKPTSAADFDAPGKRETGVPSAMRSMLDTLPRELASVLEPMLGGKGSAPVTPREDMAASMREALDPNIEKLRDAWRPSEFGKSVADALKQAGFTSPHDKMGDALKGLFRDKEGRDVKMPESPVDGFRRAIERTGAFAPIPEAKLVESPEYRKPNLLPEQVQKVKDPAKDRDPNTPSFGDRASQAWRQADFGGFARSLGNNMAGDPSAGAGTNLINKTASVAAAGLSMLGPAGAAAGMALNFAGKAVEGFGGTVEKVMARVERLGNYSGDIAGASARSEVADIMRDIREAQQLGGKYANVQDSMSDFKDVVADAFMPIKEFFLDVANDLLPVLAEVIKTVAKVVAGIINFFIRIANFFRRILGKDEIEEIIAGGMDRHERNKGAENLMTDFLNRFNQQRNVDPRDYVQQGNPGQRPPMQGNPIIPGL